MTFEDRLSGLCAKIAAGVGMASLAPRATGPRLNVPGAAASVGRWNPLKGTTGRGPPAVGAKGIDTIPASVINPNRSIKQAIVAGTSMKATM